MLVYWIHQQRQDSRGKKPFAYWRARTYTTGNGEYAYASHAYQPRQKYHTRSENCSQQNDRGYPSDYVAYSREQAVSQLKKEPAGLIVCDADMPGNEGIEILRELRGQNYRGGVIVISASCSPELTREALRLEAGDFLLKPVEENQLRSAVKGILARQRKREEEELKKEYGDCWMENHMAIKELFWKDVCLGRIRNDPEIISRKARGCNIRLDADARYRMVLITIKNVEEVQRRWGEELCQSAIQNLAKGVVKGNVQTSQVIVIYTEWW